MPEHKAVTAYRTYERNYAAKCSSKDLLALFEQVVLEYNTPETPHFKDFKRVREVRYEAYRNELLRRLEQENDGKRSAPQP